MAKLLKSQNLTPEQIIALRMRNQQLSTHDFKDPDKLLSWMAAMQAQVYPMAKWALAVRLGANKKLPLTNDVLDAAFNKGQILRTHVLRPTWHFVAPADIRWMLKLSAPRVHKVNAFMYRQCELDKKILTKATNIIVKSLEDNNHRTRNELNGVLASKKIIADGPRLAYIMMHAELEGIVCSGPLRGKQFTYALIEERVPPAKSLSDEEALASLTAKYFQSRGPATVKDFVWWSGLTVKQAMEGITMLGSNLEVFATRPQHYYWVPSHGKMPPLCTYLMPDYDEYGIAYKERGLLSNPALGNGGDVYSHWLIHNGQICGTWTIDNKRQIAEAIPFLTLHKAAQNAIAESVKRYNHFRA